MAQGSIGGFLPLSGGTLTGPILESDGAAATPSYGFSGSAGLGLFRRTTDIMGVTTGGTQLLEFTATAVKLRNTAIFGWSTSTTGSTDTAFTRVAAGIIAAGTGAAGNTSGTVRAAALAAGGSDFTVTAVNSVSPTSPNRTVTISYNGTTYYLAAKTTND